MAYYHEATLDMWYNAKKDKLSKDPLIKLLRSVASKLTAWPQPTEAEIDGYLRKKGLLS